MIGGGWLFGIPTGPAGFRASAKNDCCCIDGSKNGAAVVIIGARTDVVDSDRIGMLAGASPWITGATLLITVRI